MIMKIDFHYHYADQDGFIDGLIKEMYASNVDITLLMGGPEEDFGSIRTVVLPVMKGS